MSIIYNFYRKLGINERFPQIIEDGEFLKRFDSAFNSKSPIMMSLLYDIASRDENLIKFEDKINKSLFEKRSLDKSDLSFIKRLNLDYQKIKNKPILFSGLGNLVFIEQVISQMKSMKGNKNFDSKMIMIVCSLWIYQNIIELISLQLSELLYVIANEILTKEKKNKDTINKFLKEYESKRKKSEHLTFGRLLFFFNKLNYLKKESKLFLEKDLRNKIAHANCFYDNIRNQIIVRSGEMIEVDDFIEEFNYIKDFLFELIYSLVNQQKLSLTKDLIKLKREFLIISRSSIRSKIFKQKDLLK